MLPYDAYFIFIDLSCTELELARSVDDFQLVTGSGCIRKAEDIVF